MPRAFVPLACLVAALGLLSGPSHAGDRRALTTETSHGWLGGGVAYGPYRAGQGPGIAEPTKEQVREDLHLIAARFGLIRTYGVSEATEHALEVIREDALPLRVMLGAWIGAEEDLDGDLRVMAPIPEARAANEEQVAGVIRLAHAYPDVVWAVNVGNETQVFWSGHRVRGDVLVGYVRRVREAVACPVTTCDDFNFWNKPESARLAAEVDFIGLHAYAMWNGRQLEEALAWTREKVAEVALTHPHLPIVLAETGWATRMASVGDETNHIQGTPGQPQQELFFRAFTSWATEARLPHFYFEAFDEPWKGTPDPDGVEKHWGLWNEDRTPKMAIEPFDR